MMSGLVIFKNVGITPRVLPLSGQTVKTNNFLNAWDLLSAWRKGVEDSEDVPLLGYRSTWLLPWRGHICTLGLKQGFWLSRDHSEAGHMQQAAVLRSAAEAGGGHQLLFPRGLSRHLLPCWLHPTGPHPCFCLRRSADSTSHPPSPKHP